MGSAAALPAELADDVTPARGRRRAAADSTGELTVSALNATSRCGIPAGWRRRKTPMTVRPFVPRDPREPEAMERLQWRIRADPALPSGRGGTSSAICPG
jgi:hypothetical protein